MAKDIKDYLEYSDGTIAQRAADLAHAFVNKQTAEELQQNCSSKWWTIQQKEIIYLVKR